MKEPEEDGSIRWKKVKLKLSGERLIQILVLPCFDAFTLRARVVICKALTSEGAAITSSVCTAAQPHSRDSPMLRSASM